MRAYSNPLVAFTAAFLIFVVSSVAQAQQEPNTAPMKDTLPIEVALMYKKLSNTPPDFHALMALNPNLQSDPTRFGNDALLQQQLDALKQIYDDFNEDTVFMIKRRVTLKNVDVNARTFEIVGLQPDEPFVFSLTGDEHYGIFLRNIAQVATMTPPYVFDQFVRLSGFRNEGATFPAEIVVKPVLADTTAFPMEDGKNVLPVVGDVVEITLLHQDGQRVAIQKRYNNWEPADSRSSLMDLKDNPLDNALAK